MSDQLVSQTQSSDIHLPVLKVMGLGGGGCNAIERMMAFNLRGIEFIAANTDLQILQSSSAPVKIQLGPLVTRGLGAGGDPSVGKRAAEESRHELIEALHGADMVFLTAGMGGGTGTGAISVAAEVARELGAAVIAIVTTPFSFEVGKRQKNARYGLEALRQHTHTLLTIPNDRLIYVAPRNLPMEVAFRLADDVLRQAVQGISEIIFEPGLINVDYAHVERMIRLGGGALMSIGQGHGDRKVIQALEQALHHPLLEDINLENAAGIIANFTGGDDLALYEIDSALRFLQNQTGDQTEIIMGVMQDIQMANKTQVILMITGLGSPTLEDAMRDIQKTNQPKEGARYQPETIYQPQLRSEDRLPFITPTRPVDPVQAPEYIPGSASADVPAFLRKRSRALATNA
jgi:cell division protein FtsZ